jgi:hypothetical protein
MGVRFHLEVRLLRLAPQRKAKTGSAATVLPYNSQGVQQVRAEEAAGIEGDRQAENTSANQRAS